MTTKTKLFTSAMAGAPTLNNTAGTLIGVLDACLVTGFGTQTATSVVVASGVATATFPVTHAAAVGSVVLVAGASPGALNGEQRITAVSGNTISWETTAAAGTATGTISVKMAAAGWLKSYAGTNLAAYKSSAPEATGCLLRLDDTGTTTARVCGYEAMTDVNTGSGLFPSLAQFAAPGLWWSKMANSGGSGNRQWIVAADDQGFYFFVKAHDSYLYQGSYFGDVISLKSNDPYACVLRANMQDKSNSIYQYDGLFYNESAAVQEGLYIARAANALGGSVQCAAAGTFRPGLTATGFAGNTGFLYPSPTDNGLMLSPVVIYNSLGYRAYYPGLYFSPQNVGNSFSTGDVIEGSGLLVGKKVIAVQGNYPASPSMVFIDPLSDWR